METNRAWLSYLNACRQNQGKAVYVDIEAIEWKRLRRRLIELRARAEAQAMEEEFNPSQPDDPVSFVPSGEALL